MEWWGMIEMGIPTDVFKNESTSWYDKSKLHFSSQS